MTCSVAQSKKEKCCRETAEAKRHATGRLCNTCPSREGRRINEDLFSRLAEELDLSAATVKRLYYSEDREICEGVEGIAETFNLKTSEPANFEIIFPLFLAKDTRVKKRIIQLAKRGSQKFGKD
jgi:hypothetical protein